MTRVALISVALSAMCPLVTAAETPVPSATVADSIGVNVHLHSVDTIYRNFTVVRKLLVGLGVRHIRDGLIDTVWQTYYQEHIALGKLGIKGVFISNPLQSETLLSNWPKRVPGAFEAYEAPNEYDLSGNPQWATTLINFLPVLHRAAQSDTAGARYPVIGPSLTVAANFALLNGIASNCDYSNMHNYFGGRNPGTPGWGADGYGSIAYNLKMVRRAASDLPVVTTETGYHTGSTATQAVPEDIEGLYAPRVVLEQILHGVKRTYFYELLDEDQARSPEEQTFGLARGDGTPKPAYLALKNLIALLSDQALSSAKLTGTLQYSLSGAATVHHLLMHKKDGSFLLAIWNETQEYDPDKRLRTPALTERAVVRLALPPHQAEIIRFHPDGTVTKEMISTGPHLPLLISGAVTIIHLS